VARSQTDGASERIGRGNCAEGASFCKTRESRHLKGGESSAMYGSRHGCADGNKQLRPQELVRTIGKLLRERNTLAGAKLEGTGRISETRVLKSSIFRYQKGLGKKISDVSVTGRKYRASLSDK